MYMIGAVEDYLWYSAPKSIFGHLKHIKNIIASD